MGWLWFPLIKLAKKLKELFKPVVASLLVLGFPLIKLAKKLKDIFKVDNGKVVAPENSNQRFH